MEAAKETGPMGCALDQRPPFVCKLCFPSCTIFNYERCAGGKALVLFFFSLAFWISTLYQLAATMLTSNGGLVSPEVPDVAASAGFLASIAHPLNWFLPLMVAFQWVPVSQKVGGPTPGDRIPFWKKVFCSSCTIYQYEGCVGNKALLVLALGWLPWAWYPLSIRSTEIFTIVPEIINPLSWLIGFLVAFGYEPPTTNVCGEPVEAVTFLNRRRTLKYNK